MVTSLMLDATLLWIFTLIFAVLTSLIEADSAILNFIFVLISTVAWVVLTLHVGPYWLQDVVFGILIAVFIIQLLFFMAMIAG
jgi:hypothetical protein